MQKALLGLEHREDDVPLLRAAQCGRHSRHAASHTARSDQAMSRISRQQYAILYSQISRLSLKDLVVLFAEVKALIDQKRDPLEKPTPTPYPSESRS
jgi:hypothetical protein